MLNIVCWIQISAQDTVCIHHLYWRTVSKCCMWRSTDIQWRYFTVN